MFGKNQTNNNRTIMFNNKTKDSIVWYDGMKIKKFVLYLSGFSIFYILMLFYTHGRGSGMYSENGEIIHYVNAPFGVHINVEDWYFYGIIVLIIIDICSLMIFSLYNRLSEKNE